jgi:hypothetical protein
MQIGAYSIISLGNGSFKTIVNGSSIVLDLEWIIERAISNSNAAQCYRLYRQAFGSSEEQEKFLSSDFAYIIKLIPDDTEYVDDPDFMLRLFITAFNQFTGYSVSFNDVDCVRKVIFF